MASKKARGWRRKTRNKLSKKGSKTTIARILQGFDEGQKVQIVIDGSMHKGQPQSRYHSITGTVEKSQGMAYRVRIKDLNKDKVLVVNRAHLKGLR